MGCRCRGPHSDQHSCGEENLSSLSLEHAVHIHLGMRISSKVVCGLHAHSASHTSPREFLPIGLVEITCSSGVASKGSVGLFAKQFLKGSGMTRSLRDAGTFCLL